MDNSSYRRQYLCEYLSDERYAEDSANSTESLWKRIAVAETRLGKTLEEGYDKEDYLNLFEELHLVTFRTMIPSKSKILRYVRWLNERNVIPGSSVDALASITAKDIKTGKYYEEKYVKDFGELQRAIDTALELSDRLDEAIFATQITAIYLAWCGVPINDAIQIKKADVLEDCIQTSGGVIRPIPQIMDFIQEYRSATEYKSRGRAVITLKYVPSEWLLRTIRIDRFPNGKRLRILINNFWKSAADEDYTPVVYNYDKIYWSGIYNRAYIHEISHGEIQANDVPNIERIFHEKYRTPTEANRRLYEYRKYREHFFPSHTVS